MKWLTRTVLALALLAVASVVTAQPTQTHKVCMETSCFENNGSGEVGFQIVPGGAHEGFWSTNGLYRSLGLGVGTSTNVANQSCIGVVQPDDRLFADKDCDLAKGSGENFLDGSVFSGSQTFFFRGDGNQVSTACLRLGGTDGVTVKAMENCSGNNAFHNTTLMFPAGVDVTATNMVCSSESPGATLGWYMKFELRWRDASTYGTSLQPSASEMTCTMEAHPGDASPVCKAEMAINETCGAGETANYTQCALSVRIKEETMNTTGASTTRIRCTVFYTTTD